MISGGGEVFELLKDTKGQGMTEYALIIVAIALVVFVALTPVGNVVSNVFIQLTATF